MIKKLKKESGLSLMEAFYTIQGEGYHQGKAAYFIRLGGCDVGCHWCDVKESWNKNKHPLVSIKNIVTNAKKYSKTVVITGGEPLMWNLTALTQELKKEKINTHLETSGAHPLTGKWDWICLSPKKNKISLKEIYSKANELKIIIYNKNDFEFAEIHARKVNLKCKLFLQPEWRKRKTVMPWITDYILKNPKWKVSLQIHKYLEMP